MGIVLRLIGVLWIWMSARPVYYGLKKLIAAGSPASLDLKDLLNLVLLAGGIGLLLLKEWGRWVLMVGIGGLLLWSAGPQLLKLQLTPFTLRQLIFYGIFLILLALPQSRGATQK